MKMRKTIASLEAELATAIDQRNLTLTEVSTLLAQAEEDKATCLQFERELAEAHDSLNGAQARINQLVNEAKSAEAKLAALGTQTQRLALDTLAYREKGLFARLLWALKGGAP